MNPFRLIIWLLLPLALLAGCATPAPSVSAPASDEEVVAESIDNYRLGQGDRIAIQVFDEPDLTLETVVGASGAINYSYLGDLRVAGKSPAQLEKQITSLLQNGYLVNPSVNVLVVQYRPFYINGEVRSPGGYPYQPGLTLDKAIALAGGLTDRASVRKIFVTKGESGSSEEKKVTLTTSIEPGDIITVKEGFF